jgi:hypothetical protein
MYYNQEMQLHAHRSYIHNPAETNRDLQFYSETCRHKLVLNAVAGTTIAAGDLEARPLIRIVLTSLVHLVDSG